MQYLAGTYTYVCHATWYTDMYTAYQAWHAIILAGTYTYVYHATILGE
jgi:hypothetical protein